METSGLTSPTLTNPAVVPDAVTWQPGALLLQLSADAARPVTVQALGPLGDPPSPSEASQPLVELIITGDGRARTTTRFTNSGVGSRLRYREHRAFRDRDEEVLEVVQADPRTGLVVTSRFTASSAIAATRIVTEVVNRGTDAVVLEAVTSFAFGAVVEPGEQTTDLQLHAGTGSNSRKTGG